MFNIIKNTVALCMAIVFLSSALFPLGALAVTINYTYDYAGNRVSETDNETYITYYITPYFQKTCDLIEGQETNCKNKKFVIVNGEKIATVDGSGTSTEVFYHHNDHLGSPNVTTNQNGEVTNVEDYFPFGTKRIEEAAGSFNPAQGFAGYKEDSNTGLNYLNARYYNPVVGNFLSQDPEARDNPEKFLYDPQQLNYYSYGRNNPVNITDPSGRCIWDGCLFEIGAGIGALASYFLQPKIANAPAPGEATYSSPSDAQIAANTAVDTYLGAITLGTLGIEREAALSQQRSQQLALQGIKQEGQVIAAEGAIVNEAVSTKALTVRGPQSVNLSDHAKSQMVKRGVSPSQVNSTLQNADPFEYFHEGLVKTGYRNSQTGLFMGEIQGTGKITTVITNTSSNYPQNLMIKSAPDYIKGAAINVKK